jgi:hypothetical protein
VTPNDVADQAPTTTKRPHLLLGVACLCLLAITGALLYVKVADPFPADAKFCGGVGLAGPAASSIESAFSAWLATTTDQPPAADWHRDGTTYTNRTYRDAYGHGLRTVSVGTSGYDIKSGTQYGPDPWSVVAACV